MTNGQASAEDIAAGTIEATPDTASAPVKREDRIASLDFIRGLAVMGILAANIVAFGQPFGAYLYPGAFLTEHGATSDALYIVQFVLIDGKMRGLFTLLFGAGLLLFMDRAWARGQTIGLQARRLGFLLLFGMIHYFFVWTGDILTYYALVGFIALAFLRMEPRNLIVLGSIIYAAGAILLGALFFWIYAVADTPLGDAGPLADMRAGLVEGQREMAASDAVATELIRSGDYLGWVANQFTAHTFDQFSNVFMILPETLPLMMFGMAFYRLGMFDGGIARSRQMLWGWIALIAGALLSFAVAMWAAGNGLTFWGTMAAHVGLSIVPRLLMVLGLAALLGLYAPKASSWLGSRISAAGRVAFTNYIGTSVLMLFVFHGFGLGLFGELARPELYLVVVATWIVMLLWSKPWLERFRYGPLEWLWRCLTYGRLFPISR
ncbi:DUF418 domain-containing protein [Qipengyuania sp. JC766]|uniref:DUF418 domain-containing protein n=1 Tax=Qipengyuania sp. JC766 TaxID=3232139 RepID=UPI00345829EB